MSIRPAGTLSSMSSLPTAGRRRRRFPTRMRPAPSERPLGRRRRQLERSRSCGGLGDFAGSQDRQSTEPGQGRLNPAQLIPTTSLHTGDTRGRRPGVTSGLALGHRATKPEGAERAVPEYWIALVGPGERSPADRRGPPFARAGEALSGWAPHGMGDSQVSRLRVGMPHSRSSPRDPSATAFCIAGSPWLIRLSRIRAHHET
jgi:hypothetical protein